MFVLYGDSISESDGPFLRVLTKLLDRLHTYTLRFDNMNLYCSANDRFNNIVSWHCTFANVDYCTVFLILNTEFCSVANDVTSLWVSRMTLLRRPYSGLHITETLLH